MAFVPPYVMYGVLLFVLLMVLLMVARPRSVFDEDGRPHRFGTGPDHTMFPLGAITVVLAIISIYSFAFLDIVTTVYSLSTAK